MKISVRTVVGIYSVRATAYIMLNPDRHEVGEDEYIVSSVSATTAHGVEVWERLSNDQKEGVLDALFEEYREAKAEIAEARQYQYA